MPAKYFICPSGKTVTIETCLKACSQRCMFLPTLRAIAKSSDRSLSEPSVTELIGGTREAYLKKITAYAVKPQDAVYAIHGSAVHTINEGYTEGNMLSEIRLKDEITSGKFDLYGQIIDHDEGVLGDIKVTSSYKIMKALGHYKIDVPTGEFFKTGVRKGQPKSKKQWCYNGVKMVMEWALQLNYYRILLEKQGFPVNKMVIQAMCRNNNLRVASERGIDQSIYLIPIQKISNCWIERYFKSKAYALQQALNQKKLPSICKPRERWNGRKCKDYCSVAMQCPYGAKIQIQSGKFLPEVG